VLLCVICVFCLLVVLVRLSVPVQVIDWKDSIVSEMTYNVLMGTLNPTHSLTHSLEIVLSNADQTTSCICCTADDAINPCL